MQLPREPRPGDALDGAWGAQVVRFLRSLVITSGVGVRPRRHPGGTVIEVDVRSFLRAMPHPFQVLDASDEDGAAVSIQFGQVNSITPTADGDALDADPSPVLPITTSGVIYLLVNLDEDGIVESAEIHNAAALPAATATEGYLTLATVTKSGALVTALNQAVTHSLQHLRCGEHHLFGAV